LNPVIKVENLSKQYRLGDIGTGSIKDDFKRWRYNLIGREDPFLTVGEENDRTSTSKSDYVWALKDINFEVQQGDVLGIIGRNGAGKSTLLKILSRTTGPTTGTVKMKGRIASLLEVGTGFHGELSGRENIYLNGTIMGLKKQEINRKLDEIIAFAGVERYIDTPVKRYSSGMYVRLAFGVAAHLEPDILIIDEVLAVGDAEFQKKALGKMKEVSSKDGRTVLFVSHNMAAVKTLCTSAFVMEKGNISFSGTTAESVSKYLKGDTESQNCKLYGNYYDNKDFRLIEISFNSFGSTHAVPLDEYHQIEINVKIDIKIQAERRKITFVLNDENGEPVFTFSHFESEVLLQQGFNHLVCTLPAGFLNVGNYFLSFYLIEDNLNSIFIEKDIIAFDIQIGERAIGGWMGKEPGIIKPKFNWKNNV
jgi:lipopolysaccharide transport system ATP-binding protein